MTNVTPADLEIACPDRQELLDFDAGRLSVERAIAIGTHLDNCHDCQSYLEATDRSSEALENALRRAAPIEADADEPGFQRIQSLSTIVNHNAPSIGLLDSSYATGPSLVGTRIGAYDLLEKIGEGGMGAVYKARHERLEKLFAIKVLPAHCMQDEATVARFNREMKAIGKLAHRNIVSATDAGEDNGKHFLAMEFVEGEDLSSILRRRGPLPIPEAVHCIVQAAEALQHAHEQGIIHRDVKPANLVLSNSGEVKVLDMGLALLQEHQSPDEQGLTRSTQLMGTLEFMAPEQGLDSHDVDIRADVYSLGATLYKLLCGEAPFPTSRYDTPLKMMRVLATTPAPSIRDRDVVSAELADVLDRMLAHEPEQRYQSPQEVADALRPFIAISNLSDLLWSETDKAADARTNAVGADTKNVIKSPSGVTEQVHASPQRFAPKPRVLIAAALVGIAAFATIILLIPNKHGTLRIEIDDPSIEVAVGGDGRYQIKGKDTEFKIEPGPHTLKVTVGDTTFQTSEFSVSKGKRVSIRVTLIEGETIRVVQGDKVLHEESVSRSSIATTSDDGFEWPPDSPRPAIAPLTEEQAKAIQAEWAKYLGVPVERNVQITDDIVLTLVLIPPGEFQMGASPTEQDRFRKIAKRFQDAPALDKIPTEGPRHLVRITKPFYLGKYEVTQAQWKAIMGTSPSKLSDPQKPVENVSWVFMRRFIFKLTNDVEEQSPYLLPTESQWEYACRAGTTTPWSWGEDETDFENFVWCSDNSGGSPQPVGKLKPNAWGLHDMHGNVWEMCADRFDPNYYYESPTTDPLGPTEVFMHRAAKGGSWDQLVARTRSAHRDRCVPSLTHANVGFRVALNMTPPTTPAPRDSRHRVNRDSSGNNHNGKVAGTRPVKEDDAKAVPFPIQPRAETTDVQREFAEWFLSEPGRNNIVGELQSGEPFGAHTTEKLPTERFRVTDIEFLHGVDDESLRQVGIAIGDVDSIEGVSFHQKGQFATFSATGLSYVQQHKPGLKRLHFRFGRKDFEPWIAVVQKFEQLESIFLGRNSKVQQWAEMLGQLESLREIVFYGGDVSPTALAHLARLARLTTFRVFETNIDDEVYKQAAKLTQLKELRLELHPDVTREEMMQLANLKQLETLTLSARHFDDEFAVTLEDALALKEKLPYCTINFGLFQEEETLPALPRPSDTPPQGKP